MSGKNKWLFLAAVFLSVPGVFAQGQVSGTLTLDQKAYKITSVKAKTEVNDFHQEKTNVMLLFADAPVTEDDFDIKTLDKDARSGKIHGVCVTIDESKYPELTVLLGIGQHASEIQIDLKQFDTRMIGGRVFTKGPQKMAGHEFQIDASFTAPIAEAAAWIVTEKTGKALPAQGGEPMDAYLKCLKAIASGDIPSAKKCLDRSTAKALEGPDGSMGLKLLQMLTPDNPKFVDGFTDGDRATLHLEGKDKAMGRKAIGAVRMRKWNGQWIVSRENWKS